jgi:hypothetical protein
MCCTGCAPVCRQISSSIDSRPAPGGVRKYEVLEVRYE